MAIRTQKLPTKLDETFDERDRDEIHRIVNEMRQSYIDRQHEATRDYHQALRQVNRAEHELHRLERHMERINAFCAKHNIPLDEEA